jgi:hypothetical protein
MPVLQPAKTLQVPEEVVAEAVAVPEELELECLSGERGLERRSAVPD